MANWKKTRAQLIKSRSTKPTLRDEYASLLSQAGLEPKPKKPTALQRLSAGLGAFEWSDDALKTMKRGGSFADFVKSYAKDIPRTIAGAISGNPELVDANEGKGTELAKYLGVPTKAGQFVTGLAADILTPDMLVGGELFKGGAQATKVLTKEGKALIKGVEKVGTEEGLKTIGKAFGKEAEVIARKRALEAGTDLATIATDFAKVADESKGFTKTLEPGLYLSPFGNAEKGTKLIGGKAAGAIGRVIENPLLGPLQIAAQEIKNSENLSKIASKIGEVTKFEDIANKFDWGRSLKQSPEDYKSLTEVGLGAKTSANYVAGNAVQNMGRILKTMSKEDRPIFEAVSKDMNKVGDLVESGAGLARDTTLEQSIRGFEKAELIDKGMADAAIKGLKEMPEDWASKNFTDFENLIGQKDVMGRNAIEAIAGPEVSQLMTRRLEYIRQGENSFDNFLDVIGVPRGTRVRTLNDAITLEKYIDNADVPQSVKDYYKAVITDTYKSNIANAASRENIGLKNLGAGYFYRNYGIETAKKLSEKQRKNLIDKSQRTFVSTADLRVFNEFSGKHLAIEAGVEGLLNHIHHKALQDEAVRIVHNSFADLIEKTKMGIMDGFRVIEGKGMVKGLKKTGIPMLDKAHIYVDPATWEVFQNEMKYLTGQNDLLEVLTPIRKLNALWRGFTTAFTFRAGKLEIPMHPSFFARNWLNNKFSQILYGDIAPTDVIKMNRYGGEVYKFLETGQGGEKLIDGLSVEKLAKEFTNQGGLGGTNVQDVLTDIGEKWTDKLARFKGSGNMAQKIETSDKLAVYINSRLSGKGATESMNKVRDSLFDYSQLTDFESQYIKPWMSFYTWNKKNLVALFDVLAKDPKKIGVFDDVFDSLKSFSDDVDVQMEDVLPDYLQGAYQIWLGGKGQVGAIYGFGTNLEAINNIIGRSTKETGENLIASLAPVPRIPIELATGYNTFKGEQISADESAYQYRNLPDRIKKLMGIKEETFTNKDGRLITTYKMNPTTKYFLENMRPVGAAANLTNLFVNEGGDKELIADMMNFFTGVKYKQYDINYSKQKAEIERFKEAMQQLMDAGYINKFETYYKNKEKKL